eukprot:CFRG8399T1
MLNEARRGKYHVLDVESGDDIDMFGIPSDTFATSNEGNSDANVTHMHDEENPVSHLTFHNVQYQIHGKPILKGVSGYLPHGKLLAILGPSGAGKSTLLDILAARQKHGHVSGRVLAHFTNPCTYDTHTVDLLKPNAGGLTLDGQYQQLCGYVTQEDTFVANLTVRETLCFSQALRGSKNGSKKQITKILKTLNLSKVENTIVGSPLQRGISGGEARRLSIALGLLISPAILFIDEPTTNLDSYAALKVMRTIRKLCDKGYTVVCSIHQPRSNIYDLFDYLMILSEGHSLYYGQRATAIDYFREWLGRTCPVFRNPADYFLDLIEEDKDEDNRIEDTKCDSTLTEEEDRDKDDINLSLKTVPVQTFPERFLASDLYYQLESDLGRLDALAMCYDRDFDDTKLKTSRIKWLNELMESTSETDTQVSWIKQYQVLLQRTFIDKSRNKVQIYLRTIGATIISLVLGLIFLHTPDDWHFAWNKVNTINFGFTVFTLFSVPAISKFLEDRLILWRERGTGLYTTSAYYVSIVTVETGLLFVMTAVYSSLCYWMVGMEPTLSAYIYFNLTLFLVINISCGICQMIAAVVRTVAMAVCVYMICVAYMLLFGGFIVNSGALPIYMRWILETSFYFHATQGLFINEFENKRYGKAVQEWTGVVHMWNKMYYLEMLIVYFICVRIMAFALLRYMNREKR